MSNFFLGPYEVCPSQGLLKHDGTETKLPPRSMEVLVYFAENSDRVITNNELLNRFWSPIAPDHVVHKMISELRCSLGDNSKRQLYIKTLPRRGYMLRVTPTESKPASTLKGTVNPLIRILAPEYRKHRWIGVLAILSIVIASNLLLLRQGSSSSTFDKPEFVTVGVEFFDYKGDEPGSIDFLQKGLHTNMIDRLSRLKGVRVVVPESGKGTPGNALPHLDYLLRGTFLHAEGKLRALVRLERTKDNINKFSERFDLTEGDVFNLQDHIVSNIVIALRIHLDEKQRAEMFDWGTTNAIAYERFMKGSFHYNQFNPRDFEKAIQFYQEAVELDPAFINAYVGIATAANNLSVLSKIEKQYKLLQLVADVHRKLAAIAPNHEALVSIRSMEMRMAGIEYRRQEHWLRKQILSGNPPNFALAHYALFLIGARLIDEAERLLEVAHEAHSFELTPDENKDYYAAFVEPKEAIHIFKDILMHQPKHAVMLGSLARALHSQGNIQEAQWYLDQQRLEDPDGIASDYTTQIFAALSGRLKRGSKELDALYQRAEDFYFNNGVVAFILGDKEKGIEFWSKTDPIQRRKLLNLAQVSERYFPQHILDDPEYQQLLENLDIGKSWQHTLIEGVKVMEKATGVGLSEATEQALANGEFIKSGQSWIFSLPPRDKSLFYHIAQRNFEPTTFF